MAKTSILDKQEREGEMQSAPYQISNAINIPIEFHALIDKIDLEDESLILKIDVDISDDGLKWRYWGGVVYVGGKYEREGIPGIGTDNGRQFANKYTRIRMQSNKSLSVGAEIETIESRIVG